MINQLTCESCGFRKLLLVGFTELENVTEILTKCENCGTAIIVPIYGKIPEDKSGPVKKKELNYCG